MLDAQQRAVGVAAGVSQVVDGNVAGSGDEQAVRGGGVGVRDVCDGEGVFEAEGGEAGARVTDVGLSGVEGRGFAGGG